MKYSLFPLILLFLSILSASCTKELKYNKEELLELIQKSEPSARFLLPKSVTEGVDCGNYTSGCLSGHVLKVLGLEMILVEFQTEEEAVFAAKKFRGYYVRNWLLDDVSGEPVLEKFVTDALEAKKP